MLICLQIEVESKLALKEDEANGKTAITEEQVAGIVGGGMCLLVMPGGDAERGLWHCSIFFLLHFTSPAQHSAEETELWLFPRKPSLIKTF